MWPIMELECTRHNFPAEKLKTKHQIVANIYEHRRVGAFTAIAFSNDFLRCHVFFDNNNSNYFYVFTDIL